MKFETVFLISIFFNTISFMECINIKIGALIEEENGEIELIFHKAVEDARDRLIGTPYSLTGVTRKIVYGNAFLTSKKICEILQEGVGAVIGPLAKASSIHAMSICDAKEVPYIDIRWDTEVAISTINLHPHPKQFIRVLKDIILAFDWQGFTILYESGPYLPALNDILQLYDPKSHTITVRKYDLDLQEKSYRAVLRRVKKADDRRILVVGSTETLEELLRQAQQVGLINEHFQYIIANLDLQTINLEPYRYSDTNITGIRLVNPKHDKMAELMETLGRDQQLFVNVSLSAALVYDGVQLFAETLKKMNRTDIAMTRPVYCEDHEPWTKGSTWVNEIKVTSLAKGLTGEVKFDSYGYRSDFLLDLIELSSSEVVKIGMWNSTEGLTIQRNHSVLDPNDERTLRNKSFIVLITLNPPYGMLKENSKQLFGNNRYEGFGIDLIQELSNELGFNYTFEEQENNDYGSLNETTGQWSGMLGKIIAGTADMAITDLTITSQRESVVDFTMSFMSLGISILYKKPTQEEPKLFSFMSPFSNEVWLYLGASYIGVSLCFFILGRLSPKEWDNPFPCIEEPTMLENQFSLSNSLWFTTGALLQQGSEVAPKAPSTRTVASLWWFFTLIMVSSYTANLAAFLTITNPTSPINSAEELANKNGEIKYGAKKGGSTFKFFEDSKDPIFQKMYTYMKAHPDLLVSDNELGFIKARNENYAFLSESTSIEYVAERNCTVAKVGQNLDEKGYGIALQKNSSYRDPLTQAMLRLQEADVLFKLKNKWWKEKRGGGACIDEAKDDAQALSVKHLGGVFFVLFCGSVTALIFGIIEWIYYTYRISRRFNTPFIEELKKEFKFVLMCGTRTKQVRSKKTSPSGSRNSSISFDSSDSSESGGKNHLR